MTKEQMIKTMKEKLEQLMYEASKVQKLYIDAKEREDRKMTKFFKEKFMSLMDQHNMLYNLMKEMKVEL